MGNYKIRKPVKKVCTRCGSTYYTRGGQGSNGGKYCIDCKDIVMNENAVRHRLKRKATMGLRKDDLK